MIMLIIVSSVHWAQIGINQLQANWEHGRATTGIDVNSVARQIYYGICLGMLGLTGFECKPRQPFLKFMSNFELSLQVPHLISLALNQENFHWFYETCIYPQSC